MRERGSILPNRLIFTAIEPETLRPLQPIINRLIRRRRPPAHPGGSGRRARQPPPRRIEIGVEFTSRWATAPPQSFAAAQSRPRPIGAHAPTSLPPAERPSLQHTAKSISARLPADSQALCKSAWALDCSPSSWRPGVPGEKGNWRHPAVVHSRKIARPCS